MDNPASLKLKATLPTARSCPYRRGQSSSASTAPTCATGTTNRRSSRSLSASRCRRFGTPRYFGLVQTHDDKPERRLFEVLRSQDLRMNQGLTFLTDGGDSSFPDGISPGAENYLDWFHITMRLTVLSQYTKGLAHHSPVEALAPHSRLDRIKGRLWHGDTDVALSRARELAEDVAALTSDYPGLQRLAKAAAGLATHIDNNKAAIPNYGERRRYAEPISTAFVESTVN